MIFINYFFFKFWNEFLKDFIFYIFSILIYQLWFRKTEYIKIILTLFNHVELTHMKRSSFQKKVQDQLLNLRQRISQIHDFTCHAFTKVMGDTLWVIPMCHDVNQWPGPVCSIGHTIAESKWFGEIFKFLNNDGVFYDRFFNNGVFYDGVFNDGVFYDGVFWRWRFLSTIELRGA